jgi:hypothetical protein
MSRFKNDAPVKVVFATATCGTATVDGIGVNIREGDVWAADDPICLARPGLFSDTPPAPNFPRRTVAIPEAR